MLSLILKTSNACNLRCDYCSTGVKKYDSIMSCTQMIDSICWFIEYAKKQGESEAFVIFHGGEPLLIPTQDYIYCIESIKNKYSEFNVKYSIQTNGTIVNDEVVKMISQYDLKIGISLDGERQVHDCQRHFENGDSTYDIVVNNIKTLKNAEVDTSIIQVVTKHSIKAGVSFLNLLANLQVPIKINPLLDVGMANENDSLKLQSGDYAKYLINIIKYIENNKLPVLVSPVCELILKTNKVCDVRGCTFQKNCINYFLCIDSNGDIYPCGRFADAKLYKYGNISVLSQEEIIEKKNVNNICFQPSECVNCKYLKLCNAGCLATRVANVKSRRLMLCDDYKEIFSFLENKENYPFYYDFVLKFVK